MDTIQGKSNKNFEIDGTNMIEQDSEGVTYCYQHKDYPLEVGRSITYL